MEELVSVKLKTINHFTFNDAIVNGLHISNAGVPAELTSLLIRLRRVRRPLPPTAYVQTSYLIPTVAQADFLLQSGRSLNVFGDDADAFPVQSCHELVHYEHLKDFILDSCPLAVPPSQTFLSTQAAGNFNSFLLGIIARDYRDELEFAFDTAYFIDIMLIHPKGEPVKYSMKGDFFVRTRDQQIPFIFGEVDSNCNNDDKFRMLLLVHSFMRICRSVGPSSPNPLAIFVTKELIAEVHIFYFADDGPNADIRCHKIDYDLKSHNRLARFVLFLRNYLDATKSLWSGQTELRSSINAIRVLLRQYASRTRVIKRSKGTGGSGGGSGGSDGSGGGAGSDGGDEGGAEAGGSGLFDHPEEEEDSEPSDGGVGNMDWKVVNSGTPADTWQHLLKDRRAILVTKAGEPVLVAKLVGQDEWSILKTLQGVAGVVPILRHDALPDDSHIILMPWLGCSIDGYLYFTKNPSPDSRRVALSFLRALSRIHSRRVAHLDLKLTNVRVSIDNVSDGTVNIIDFGHSAVLDKNLNFIEGETGTYGWSAPEVVSGEPYDAFLADIWSAGRILTRYAHGPANHVDRWLENLGDKMQARDPTQRTALSAVIRAIELDAIERVSVSP